MAKYLPVAATTIIALFFVGCGGETETANSGGPALSSVDANERGADTAAAARESRQRDGAAEAEAEGADSVATNESSGPVNGLFPDMPLAGVTFGGGLFPDFQPSDDAMSEVAAKEEMSDTYPTDSGEDKEEMMASKLAEGEGESAESDAKAMMASKSKMVSLLPQAMKMFMEHADQEAIDVVYANYLISDEAREQYGLNWYPGIKEPRMLFRWGVGVVFNKPRELAGRHPVIGDPGDPNEGVEDSDRAGRRGGRGGGGGLSGAGGGGLLGGGRSRSGSRTYKDIDTSRPDGFLMYYTGDFGEQLISFLDGRRKDDHYGQILKDVMEQEMASKDGEEASSASESSGFRRRETSSSNFGGAPATAGGGNRRGGRRGSRSNSQPLQRTDTSVLERAMGQSTAEKPADDASGSILPGVSLLGVGSKVDIVSRAKAANIDGLVIFNVKVSKSRGGNARNRANTSPDYTCTTSMKIVDLATEKNVFSSKSLKDTTVKEENDEGEDPVKDQVARAFSTYADASFRATDLPGGLNESAVKKRVGRLLRDKSGQPLAAAVEIISYYKSELLTAELAETAVTRLFGSDDAKVLVDGAAADRLEFLKTVLPNGLGTSP